MGRTIHELYSGSQANCERVYLTFFEWQAVRDAQHELLEEDSRTMLQSDLDRYVSGVSTFHVFCIHVDCYD
jgi:hypothetical protein